MILQRLAVASCAALLTLGLGGVAEATSSDGYDLKFDVTETYVSYSEGVVTLSGTYRCPAEDENTLIMTAVDQGGAYGAAAQLKPCTGNETNWRMDVYQGSTEPFAAGEADVVVGIMHPEGKHMESQRHTIELPGARLG
ncbi:DUF6299 family protein [Saccharothrix sp. NPDC042600]|uniref:DUF6299 family protein n=1 Tax=Saccharothrix TaxID=2071 RepID=UPI00340B00D3|nr:hypothetical protein GCM10017745_45450 [Saccharothrix mutabilis subsp. capreolus]